MEEERKGLEQLRQIVSDYRRLGRYGILVILLTGAFLLFIAVSDRHALPSATMVFIISWVMVFVPRHAGNFLTPVLSEIERLSAKLDEIQKSLPKGEDE